ncbi:MAG: hypothetical protein HZB33_15955 [Nitrospirae bacterium]|nr:hypothetical protein [Nitrospirota bacterium]
MKKTVLLLIIVMALISCGKKEVKQVSPESLMSQEAFALAETLRTAFINNDKDALQKHSTPEGFRDITAGKKGFDKVELSFTPRWVEIENTKTLLNISWKSAWTAGSRKSEDRGMAVFQMEGKPLKLTKIIRANPFIYPEQ